MSMKYPSALESISATTVWVTPSDWSTARRVVGSPEGSRETVTLTVHDLSPERGCLLWGRAVIICSPQPVGDPMPPFPGREMSAADLHGFLFRESKPWRCSVCGWDERMDATQLSVFHFVSNHTCEKRSSLSQLCTLSNLGFFRARDCMIFTLHDLADFYVERVTAHSIKINYHSCFHNLWPNSKTKLKLKHIWEQGGPLVFWGPYAAYTTRILLIGTIGSGCSTYACCPT